jgi:hypothetical protein
MSNDEFKKRAQAVYESRDQWIGLIESRLNDLTGLRLSKDPKYQYLFEDNYDQTPIKRKGKNNIVVFPTDLIELGLGTNDQHEVWSFILGRIGIMAVFEKSIEFYNKKPGDSAEAQLAAIQKEVLRLDDGDFGISDILGVFSYNEHMIKLFAQVIAYHSNLLKVESEDLAFVVLAHELAHAFTIAGYDINGYRGQLLIQPGLRHKYIIEGLAQYYTEAICHQLEKQFPQFKAAFEALLSSQTYPYTWHKHWFSGNQAHECVRSLLLDYRDQMNSEYFMHHLSLSDALLNSIP